MKVFIMTDLEGVAGVMNSTDWIYPDSRYYDRGRELLTQEVNAAVDGFFAAGADEVVVSDGHGHGAMDIMLLDERAKLQRGWRGIFPGTNYPFGLDDGYDVMAWVGQHPKAGTERGHLCHTGNFSVLNYTINGISVGEFGQALFIGQHYGVVPIFASGCLAFTKEAQDLVSGIETVAVKEGVAVGTGDECTVSEYERRNWGAIHLQPKAARKRIREGAERALRRYMENPASFQPKRLSPPFQKCMTIRPQESGGEIQVITREDPDSVVMCMAK